MREPPVPFICPLRHILARVVVRRTITQLLRATSGWVGDDCGTAVRCRWSGRGWGTARRRDSQKNAEQGNDTRVAGVFHLSSPTDDRVLRHPYNHISADHASGSLTRGWGWPRSPTRSASGRRVSTWRSAARLAFSSAFSTATHGRCWPWKISWFPGAPPRGADRSAKRAARTYAADPERRGCLVLEAARGGDDSESAMLARRVAEDRRKQIRTFIAASHPSMADLVTDFVASAMSGLSAGAREGMSGERLVAVACASAGGLPLLLKGPDFA